MINAWILWWMINMLRMFAFTSLHSIWTIVPTSIQLLNYNCLWQIYSIFHRMKNVFFISVYSWKILHLNINKISYVEGYPYQTFLSVWYRDIALVQMLVEFYEKYHITWDFNNKVFVCFLLLLLAKHDFLTFLFMKWKYYLHEEFNQ